MLTAAIWGLVQGLTEFLPISSSGHLVLVPALLGIPEPDLATSAVLHIGTLAAVMAYYRRDLLRMIGFRSDPQARRVLSTVVWGTVPAVVAGLLLEGPLAVLFSSPRAVAVALVSTGLILAVAGLLPVGRRPMEESRFWDALLVGTAQAFALVPGISRSGATIVAALARRFRDAEAVRFSFLLAIPATASASLFELWKLGGRGQLDGSIWLGVALAATSGYASIAWLLRAVVRFGLAPFAVYCLAAGTISFVLLG